MSVAQKIVSSVMSGDAFSRARWRNWYAGKFARTLTRQLGNRVGGWFLTRQVDFSGLKNPSEPVVLCLERYIFSKDIAQLQRHSKLNYVTISQGVLSSLQRSWLPQELSHQCVYIEHEDAFAEERAQADALCLRFLKELSKVQRISAVLSANVDYAQDASMKNACRQLDIPFLVLCKEVHITDYFKSWAIGVYESCNYKFKGDGVAVLSESQREVLVGAGVCHEEQVWVTGAPRFDAWKEIELNHVEQKNAVLLSFYGYGSEEEFLETLYTFAEQSNYAPEGRFIVKCKLYRDRDETQKLLEGRAHRLRFVLDKPLHELLPTAKLIIGFNSMAMIEALLTGAKLVLPHFGGIPANPDNLMLSPEDARVRREFHFAESVVELRAHIAAAMAQSDAQAQVDMKARQNLFYRYFCRPRGGTFSAEVDRFIRSFVRNEKKARHSLLTANLSRRDTS